jgi:hypothetical protein
VKITQTVFVHYDTEDKEWMGWNRWELRRYECTSDKDIVFVGTTDVTFEVPDDFDPRPAQVKALQEKERELRAQFAAAVTEIQRQISQLQAIEHTEAAS